MNNPTKTSKVNLNECKTQGLSNDDIGLARRLLTRLESLAERTFVGGRYLIPCSLRYDSQDGSRYTVDKTCIFFSFPYISVADTSLRKHFSKGDARHPPRTILQSRYRLNTTIDRDRFQCIRSISSQALGACVNASESEQACLTKKTVKRLLIYVPQHWGLIIGLGWFNYTVAAAYLILKTP